MACVSKIGSLYEMVTKNVIVSTTNTVFGINPRAWIALPCEGLILLKIRQVVPTAGSALPVQIAVPANSTVSTVGADTCCPVTGVNVVNPINVAVTLRSRSRSFRWCGSHSKKYDSRIPVFPVWKKRNKNIIPVGGQ